MFQLSARLAAVAEKTKGSHIVVDIGTDHAYLPIYLLYHNYCEIAIAVDIEDMPLKLAKLNIDKYHLNERIIVKKGNGLAPIELSEIDTIVIAGMGAYSIMKILESDIEKAKAAKKIILQPMRNEKQLQQWLEEHKFILEKVEYILDKKRSYFLIQTKFHS